MEKNTSGLLVILVVLSLLIGGIAGGLVGYNSAPEKTITQTETEIVYQNISVDKIVEIQAPSVLDKAVAEFLKAVEDEEDEAENDITILDDMDYNFDEVSVYEVSDEYSINIEDDGDVTTINFEIRLKFKDSHDSEKETFDVTVIFEDDEDTEVIVA